MAAWAPHVYLTEGAILLSSTRTAPFVSPLRVDPSTNGTDAEPVSASADYREKMQDMANETDTWCWKFDDGKSLTEAVGNIENKLRSE